MATGQRWNLESTWRFTKNVRLSPDERELIWERPFTERRTKSLNERQVFEDFIELGDLDAKPQDFLRFARAYGPLLLCEHGLPMSHVDLAAMEFLPGEIVNSHTPMSSYGRRAIREDVERWGQIAEQARAMTSIAGDLRLGPISDADRWSVLSPLVPFLFTVEGHVDGDIAAQRRMLARAVQTWLDWSDVRVTHEWNTASAVRGAPVSLPHTRIGASSLFGSLALGLTLAIAHGTRFEICSGCGRDFIPKRPRDPSKRIWCGSDECRLTKLSGEVQRFRQRSRERAAEA